MTILRVEVDVKQYLSANYEVLLDMAKTITKNRYPDYEELTHIVCLILLEADPERMQKIIAKKQMRYWCVRVMMNQYHSSTSPYHYTYRKPVVRNHIVTTEINEWVRPLTEEEWEEMMSKESLHNFIDEQLSKQPYFERMCTLIYYEHEHSLNTLAEETGISRTTLYKSIRKTRHAIKEEYEG